MKSTGIIRKVDELGRVVIPIELRNKFGIAERDPIEIYVDGSSIILKKFEPTTLATLISFWPAKEDVILTAASGAEVPMATIVSPIIIDGTLNFLAIEAVPSTKKSAPFISKIKPIIKKI